MHTEGESKRLRSHRHSNSTVGEKAYAILGRGEIKEIRRTLNLPKNTRITTVEKASTHTKCGTQKNGSARCFLVRHVIAHAAAQ